MAKLKAMMAELSLQVKEFLRKDDGVEESCYSINSLCKKGRMTPQDDIFSFGVVLLRLATGKGVSEIVERTATPIRELVEVAIEQNRFDTLVDGEWPSKETAKKMADLGLKCFQPRWRRPDAASLLKSLMDIASDR